MPNVTADSSTSQDLADASGTEEGNHLGNESSRRPKAELFSNIASALVLSALAAAGGWFMLRPDGAKTSQDISLAVAASGPAPRVGREVPDFQVLKLDGTVAHLSDFRGQPIWLSFWATWCPPCRSESPEIEAATRKYSDSGLVVLALDLGESPQAVSAFVERAGLTYSIGLDRSEEVAALYHVFGLPNHFFIDRDGILRERRVGQLDPKAMDKSLASILKSRVSQ